MASALTLAIALLVPGLILGLVIYCLRVGAVGNNMGSGRDAHRDKQPFLFWMRIITMSAVAVFWIAMVIYLSWATRLQ